MSLKSSCFVWGNEMSKAVSQQQIGGSHYKDMPDGLQPIQLAYKLNLSPAQFSILKYLFRYKRKNGAEDIQKVIHYAQIILEQEYGITSEIEYRQEPWEEDDSEPIPL